MIAKFVNQGRKCLCNSVLHWQSKSVLLQAILVLALGLVLFDMRNKTSSDLSWWNFVDARVSKLLKIEKKQLPKLSTRTENVYAIVNNGTADKECFAASNTGTGTILCPYIYLICTK